MELNLKHARRGADLSERWEAAVRSLAGLAPDWPGAQALEQDIESYLAATCDQRGLAEWRVASAWLRTLTADRAVREVARTPGGSVTNARDRLAILLQELDETLSLIGDPGLRQGLTQCYDLGAMRVRREPAAAALRRLPLPTLYFKSPDDHRARRGPTSPPAPGGSECLPILKVICFLDGSPLVSPQILQAGVLYSLKFRVGGRAWPPAATALRLDLLSTVPPTAYGASPFVIEKPAPDGPFEVECTGHLQFSVPQSAGSGDMVFATQGGFLFAGRGFVEAPVVGHHELRFQVPSEQRTAMASGNRQLDAHVTSLLDGLRRAQPSVAPELPTLQLVLEALVGILGVFAQEGTFKGQVKVEEKQFQQEVVRLMRLKLGPDVQEHGHQAGGITDIRFRGVVVELKVETGTGDRAKIAAKYTAQATQYAGCEARQVSVVLVLDLTPKENPPGDIRNDILLAEVPTHGAADNAKNFPAKAFVVVVNGNTRNPSSYS